MSRETGDAEFEAAVHEAFAHQARHAPTAAGLLEAVKARRRRRVRGRVLIAAVATAVAASGTLIGTHLPGGGADATGSAAVRPDPGIFAADEIDLCLIRENGRLAEVMLFAEAGGEELQTEVSASAGQPFHVHAEHTPDYTVRLDVLRGTPAGEPLANARETSLGDRAGRIGDAPGGGGRVLSLETGTEGVVLRLGVEGTGPGDAQLLAWARKINVSGDRAACDA
ncbi:hypothetical protein [Streptomyces litchfieldiae]|uniref:Uncharacterized protein n=1 Tax=Streptomyces litchfieldiae TaxID=3075543 RepID=A0ABU2MX30_9ACTN|nr:hypothetical protein [Streptomyces sp. DSM 44938]MDT0346211.1 hypothetical protein [Streptomyces sp. DSM 44938]